MQIFTMVIFGLAVVLTALFVWHAWARYRPLAILAPVWLGVGLVAATVGIFGSPEAWTRPDDLVGFAALGTLMSLPVAAYGWARATRAGFRAYVAGIPLPLLHGLAFYRVGGAIFLWMALQEKMPPAFGVTAGLADIAVGLTAVPVALLLWWRQVAWTRRVAVTWNLFGLADFAVAIPMVALSLFGVLSLVPDPVRIGFEVGALISVVMVPLSICLHWEALRRLAASSARMPPTT